MFNFCLRLDPIWHVDKSPASYRLATDCLPTRRMSYMIRIGVKMHKERASYVSYKPERQAISYQVDTTCMIIRNNMYVLLSLSTYQKACSTKTHSNTFALS